MSKTPQLSDKWKAKALKPTTFTDSNDGNLDEDDVFAGYTCGEKPTKRVFHPTIDGLI